MSARVRAVLDVLWLTVVATAATLVFVMAMLASAVVAVTEGVGQGLALMLGAGALLFWVVAAIAHGGVRIR